MPSLKVGPETVQEFMATMTVMDLSKFIQSLILENDHTRSGVSVGAVAET